MIDQQAEPTRPTAAAEVCQHFELTPEASLLLQEEQTPQQLFADLTRAGLYDDAIRFAAAYLSPREAVWWGVLCLWQVIRRPTTGTDAFSVELNRPQETRLLRQIVQWVSEPTEENRRSIERPMHAAPSCSLAKNLALAAFYSGGNISTVDQPAVPPPRSQTPNSVAAAVKLASQVVLPRYHEACLLHFLKLASQVSLGEAPIEATLPTLSTTPPPEMHHAH